MKRLLTLAALPLALAISTPASAGKGDPVAGKEKSATCAACHGPEGNSPAPTFPKLAGQYESYLIFALEAYKTGSRQNQIMAGMAATLSDQDRADLAAFYASQKSELSILVSDR